MKRISKKEASEKYGVSVTGPNSLYKYYLLDNGNVIDDDGDVRYDNVGNKIYELLISLNYECIDNYTYRCGNYEIIIKDIYHKDNLK